MRISTSFHDVPVAGVERPMRTLVAAPAAGGDFPAVAFYSDIFQLSEATVRWVSRLASYGFVVAAPEIYYRIEPAGTVLPFDDDGKARGQADVEALTTAQFDEDIAALLSWLPEQPGVAGTALGVAGHCTGGHLAFRAAMRPEVAATVCWYPTGLADGRLGADPDSGSLAQSERIDGPMLLIFGGSDPHTPAADRDIVRHGLDAAGVDYRWSVVEGAEHAFGRDVGPRWDPQATDKAFAQTVAFFGEHLLG